MRSCKISCLHKSINQSKHICIAPYVANESEAHDTGGQYLALCFACAVESVGYLRPVGAAARRTVYIQSGWIADHRRRPATGRAELRLCIVRRLQADGV